jgi:hypothetical protein
MTTRSYDFISGPETSTLPLPGTPSGDGDILSLGYANANYLSGKASVLDLTALKGVAAADRANGMTILVRSTGFLYHFDSAGTGTNDDDLIITPTAGTGRWFRITDFQGPISQKDATQSSSTSTGALVLAGGLGVAKNVYIGGNLNLTGTATGTFSTTPILPAAMSDAEATELGHKQYLSTGSYNGGGAPTVSGTNWTTTRAVFVPYKMQDGTWRLRFNVCGSISSATASIDLAFDAVTFIAGANNYQACSGFGDATMIVTVFASPGTNSVSIYQASSTSTNFRISGDVELNSKPTWAY